MTTDLRRQLSGIPFKQPIEGQTIRTVRWNSPYKLRIHALLNERQLLDIADEEVQPRPEPFHTMDEYQKVNRRIIGPHIPWHRPFQLWPFCLRHDLLHHVEKHGCGN